MKFQLLLKSKMLKIMIFALNISDDVFIMLKNIIMPAIVGISTFMSMIHLCLVQLSMVKRFITSRPCQAQISLLS